MSKCGSRSSLALLALSLMLVAAGCRTRTLAELQVSEGQVTRDYSDQVGSWKAAAVGAEFTWGDGLRTGPASSARLRVGTGRVLVESEATIRFLRPGSSAADAPAGVEISQGRAVIEALEAALPIRTRSGSATLRPGTRVEIVPAADGERYRVLMGAASFTEADGATVEVAEGRSINVGIGRAVLEEAEQSLNAASDQALHEPAAGAAVVDAGGQPPVEAEPAEEALPPAAAVSEPGAADAELLVAAGESFRVYDPRPPTVIGFSTADFCPEQVEISVSRVGKQRGRGVVTVLAPAGSFSYKVRCLAGAARGRNAAPHGNFRVLRADGTRPLPKSAPRNTVELDGRKYTLMYQNLRPAITIVWPDAPSAASYTVSLQLPNGTTRTLGTREPRFALPPGVLLDGAHSVAMRSDGGNPQSSKTTTLNVSFDNAAPAASLEAPSPLGFAAGETVHVQGVAVAGARVSIDGRPIELSDDQRFALDHALPPGARALAVRFQDPGRGTSYYVRRRIGSP
ncbi:MAG TPA: hypothetical protein VJV78_14520 [Polyangiales bacterium]|nr:hypothetical protein [Polyangiales bacterium]